MADLNALIAQGYQTPAPIDPFAQYAKMQQLNVGQNQNALAQYQLAQAQRQDVQANALNAAYASGINPDTGEIDYAKVRRSLATGGAGSQIPTLEKSRLEQQTAALNQQKLLNEIAAQPVTLAKAKIETVDAQLKQSKERLNQIDPYSPDAGQQLLAWHQSNHQGLLGETLRASGSTPEQTQGSIQEAVAGGPAAIAKFIERSTLGQTEFAKNIAPIPEKVSDNKTTFFIDKNPKSPTFGQKIGGAGFEMGMTPYEEKRLPIQQGQLAVSQGQLAVAQQRLQAEMATGNLTPETIDFMAETYRQTGTLPPMGMGPMAAAARSKILTRAGELAMGGGQTAAQAATDVRTNKAENAGLTSGQRAIGTQIANVQVAANEANKMIEVAKPYVTKVNPTDYPVLNAAGNYVAKNTGDPNIVGLATSLNAIVNTYARAINPKGTATVSDKNHAREILNAAMSKGQLNEAFNVMNQEMGAALASGPETKAGMRTANTPAAPSAGKVVDFGSLK
jgi:hypothetical protein